MAVWKSDLKDHHVTPQAIWMNRRQLLGGATGAGLLAGGLGAGPSQARTHATPNPLYSTDETPTSFDDITSYNNFDEFGFGKDDPKKFAGSLTTAPWSIEIGGACDRPGSYALEDILSRVTIEERIYRFSCVEAWSMVIPWFGFQLSELLAMVEPTSAAKYVAFETLLRPEEMPAQQSNRFPWPYVEGLRMDEALNPLTLMATGIYEEFMPNQNGAPVRLVVPWKYGFKSIKSIVKITLTETQPPNTWNVLQPREYGFYSNVNPEVDHPRWSQASHRVVGGGLFAGREPTKMFNGYGEFVAEMYAGMDLRKNY
ncbi:MAG: protein-methionine-sulfoxide reductase catalytic subunit MsrP [Pseudomonadota bacterium]